MKSKNKHDHRLTNFLKVFIFMIIMLAPFFAIGVKCWYVANNPNAVQSYTGNYKYQATLDINTIKNNNTITSKSYEVNNTTNYYYDNILLNNTFYTTHLTRENRFKKEFAVYVNEFSFNQHQYNNKLIAFSNGDGNSILKVNVYDIEPDFNCEFRTIGYYNFRLFIDDVNQLPIDSWDFTINSTQSENILTFTTESYWYLGTHQNLNIDNLFTDLYYTDFNLSSVFYSAVQELDKASIFSWTTKTAIYSGLLAMSEGLGVDTPPLAVLLTYWTIITSIYIIIDIVLEMFIFLTHWLNDKIY